MALGLPTAGAAGDIMPRIQYDARAGRFFLVERRQDSGGQWVSELSEMPLPMRLAMDLANIEIGWIRLQGAVDFRMVRVGEPMPDCPGEHYRSGFRVTVYRKDIGIRSFNSTAKAVIGFFDQLHTEWQAQAPNHAREWPIVDITKTTPITTGNAQQSSTNYAPIGTITDWIPAPTDGGQSSANGNGQPAPAATPPVDDGFGAPPPPAAAGAASAQTATQAAGQDF